MLHTRSWPKFEEKKDYTIYMDRKKLRIIFVGCHFISRDLCKELALEVTSKSRFASVTG